MGALRSEASVGELLGMLADDSGELVRQELRLAAYEVVDRAKDASGKIGIVALGGGLAHAGLLGIITAAIIGLSMVIPLWASALIIGAIFFVAGVAVAMKGMKLLRHPVMKAIANTTSNATDTKIANRVSAKDGLR